MQTDCLPMTEDQEPMTRRRMFLWFAGSVVTTSAAASAIVATRLRPTPLPDGAISFGPPAGDEDSFDRDAAIRACRKSINANSARDFSAIEESYGPLDDFIDRARQRTPAMVDDLLDLGSTVKIGAKSAYDWWNVSTATDMYVARFLKSYLDLPDGLATALQATVEEIEQRWKANEQTLYSQIEADLKTQRIPIQFGEVKQSMSVHLTKTLTSYAKSQGIVSVAREVILGGILSAVVSKALPKVLATIGTRVGVSSASAVVTGTGAVAGLWTGGASLVVGLLAGLLIDYIAGKIQRNAAISTIQSVLIEARDSARSQIGQAAKSLAGRMAEGRMLGIEDCL